MNTSEGDLSTKITVIIIGILVLSYIIYSAYLQTRVRDNEIICRECGEWFQEYGHYHNGLILSIPRGICPTCDGKKSCENCDELFKPKKDEIICSNCEYRKNEKPCEKCGEIFNPKMIGLRPSADPNEKICDHCNTKRITVWPSTLSSTPTTTLPVETSNTKSLQIKSSQSSP